MARICFKGSCCQISILVGDKWNRVKARRCQCTSRCGRTSRYEAKTHIRKERWVEADILEDIVVDTVVHNTESASNNNLLITASIPRESKARREVVPVLVPDRVPGLERTGSNSCEIRVVRREER